MRASSLLPRISIAFVTLAPALSACAARPATNEPTGPAPTASRAVSSGPTASGSIGLRGARIATVRVDGGTLRVALADDEAAWERGLQGVSDLAGLDGMLFRFGRPVDRSFWMKDTEIPLDLAFVDAAGRVLEVIPMSPCRSDPCPTYRASAPYLMALETPAGSLPDLRSGDEVVVETAPSP